MPATLKITENGREIPLPELSNADVDELVPPNIFQARFTTRRRLQFQMNPRQVATQALHRTKACITLCSAEDRTETRKKLKQYKQLTQEILLALLLITRIPAFELSFGKTGKLLIKNPYEASRTQWAVAQHFLNERAKEENPEDAIQIETVYQRTLLYYMPIRKTAVYDQHLAILLVKMNDGSLNIVSAKRPDTPRYLPEANSEGNLIYQCAFLILSATGKFEETETETDTTTLLETTSKLIQEKLEHINTLHNEAHSLSTDGTTVASKLFVAIFSQDEITAQLSADCSKISIPLEKFCMQQTPSNAYIAPPDSQLPMLIEMLLQLAALDRVSLTALNNQLNKLFKNTLSWTQQALGNIKTNVARLPGLRIEKPLVKEPDKISVSSKCSTHSAPGTPLRPKKLPPKKAPSAAILQTEPPSRTPAAATIKPEKPLGQAPGMPSLSKASLKTAPMMTDLFPRAKAVASPVASPAPNSSNESDGGLDDMEEVNLDSDDEPDKSDQKRTSGASISSWFAQKFSSSSAGNEKNPSPDPTSSSQWTKGT